MASRARRTCAPRSIIACATPAGACRSSPTRSSASDSAPPPELALPAGGRTDHCWPLAAPVLHDGNSYRRRRRETNVEELRKERIAMRHPSSPGNNPSPRTRGAIRTHLGRKRSGARGRSYASESGRGTRGAQEDVFDRLMGQVQSIFNAAGERSVSALDSALDAAFGTLVNAGEFTAENAQRLRNYLKRDLLHRE